MSPRHPTKARSRTAYTTPDVMEFRTFLDLMIHVPCQVIRDARKTVYRLLTLDRSDTGVPSLCDSLQIS
ncbi:MAG: hypothetical protein R3C49_02780 [Planctomycetaceae bacterium]